MLAGIQRIADWIDAGNGGFLWLMSAAIFLGGLGCIEGWRRTRNAPVTPAVAGLSIAGAILLILLVTFFSLVVWHTESPEPPYDPVDSVKQNGMMALAAAGIAVSLIGRIIHLLWIQRGTAASRR